MEKCVAMAPKKQPNPIDIHVGSRLRLRRTMVGMTQEKLGEQLGVTFQQVQKYEKGMNRIGASRLQEISRILDVPVSFFFEDAREEAAPADGDGVRAFREDPVARFEVSAPPSEAQALTRAFSQIPDARVRRRILDLVETLADAHRI